MTVSASLPVPSLPAEPGKVAACDVRITNSGDAARTVDMEATGPAAAWALVLPSTLDLPPGRDRRARVTFCVPDARSVAPGPVGFTIAVHTRDHGGDPAVEVRGSVEVAATRDLHVAVRPLISRARRRARHTVIVENRGNVAADTTLEATDLSGTLAVGLAGSRVAVGPGERIEVGVSVSARRGAGRPWRGSRSHRFAVAARTGDGPTTTAEGVFHQDAPRRTVPIVAAMALCVAAGLAWRPDARVVPAAAGTPTPSVAAAPVAACSPEAEDGIVLVAIERFAYCPATVTVPVGTELRWTNRDAAPHTATSASAETAFESGTLDQGRSYATRLDRPGTYEYYCRFHPGMRATVRVV